MPNPFAGNLVWLSSLLNPGPRQVRSAIGRPYNANFERFLDISSKEGTDGYGNRVPFISRKALEGYWLDDLDECRISHALSSKVLVSERDISEDYLIIFSILIHIGRTEFIDQFAEIGFMGKHLPIMRRHPFGGSPAVQEMADEFYHYQWRFCPVLFLSENRSVGRGLQPSQILLIEFEECLDRAPSNAKAVIKKVKLYDDCTEEGSDRSDKMDELGTCANPTLRQQSSSKNTSPKRILHSKTPGVGRSKPSNLLLGGIT
ncbi:hypothetical protein ACJZ2D_004022 [Fusarium nematophilum]